MSIFNRLFKVAQAEAHSVIENLEDPIKLTEQGIRDLKVNLQEAMQSLAQVKSVAIRQKKDADDQKKMAAEYERKAMLLLQKMQAGSLDPVEAEGLAGQVLEKKEEATQRASTLMVDYEAQKKMSDQLQVKVEKLKRDISRFENELVTLRARARTAESMRKINQQMAGADSSSTVAMLDRMKDKVQQQESLAAAYGEMGDATATLDDKIEGALSDAPSVAASDSLAEMKKRLGIEA